MTVGEPALDAVTGLSGSGPAYVFLVAEAMIEAGVLEGLPRDVAEKLVVQTLLGSATLLAQSDDGPAALRAAVTSPGGTTAAGLRELEAGRRPRRDPRRGERRDPALARELGRTLERTGSAHEQIAESSAATGDDGRTAGARAAADVGGDLERSHVAGQLGGAEPVGAAALVERAAGDRVHPALLDDAWAAVQRVFGATGSMTPRSIPRSRSARPRAAVARIVEVANVGGARRARDEPARVVADRSISRSPGSHGSPAPTSPTATTTRARCGSTAAPIGTLRWVDGVAVVTDGQSLCATAGPKPRRSGCS